MPLKAFLTFFLVAGWIVLETYGYVLIGRSVRRYCRRFGFLHWIIILPVGLLAVYFLIILLS